MRTKVNRPVNFLRNHIVLGIDKKSKARIVEISDLNTNGVKWIACVETAPCGKIAFRALKTLGTVTTKPASFEASVSSVVAKLLSHEADAGFIYETDVRENSLKLRGLRFERAIRTDTVHQIALLKRSNGNASALAFYRYLTDSEAMKFLLARGFNRP